MWLPLEISNFGIFEHPKGPNYRGGDETDVAIEDNDVLKYAVRNRQWGRGAGWQAKVRKWKVKKYAHCSAFAALIV